MSKFKVGQKANVVGCREGHDSFIGETIIIDRATDWGTYRGQCLNKDGAPYGASFVWYDDELEAINE